MKHWSDSNGSWVSRYSETLMPIAIRCLLVTVLTTAMLVAIMYAGNLSPSGLVKTRFLDVDSSSLRYTECEVGLSLIIDQEINLLSALMARTYAHQDDEPCESLIEMIVQNPDVDSVRLRPRYWWGFKSVYSLLLTRFSIGQISQIMEWGTYLAFIFLGIALIRLGNSTFIVTSPFVLVAPVFSGVHFYTDAPIALGFLWGVLTSTVFAFLKRSHLEQNWIYPFVLFAGMVSAFLWFMGGEVLFIVPLLMLINYFANFGVINERMNFVGTALVAFMFHVGFCVSMLFGYFLKAMVYGVGPVISSFTQAAAHRLSYETKGIEISNFNVLKQLFYRGFQHTAVYDNVLIWKVLIISGVVSGSIGTVYLVRNAIREPEKYGFILTFFIISFSYFFARVLVVPNHSFTHSWMIGRYMIVPICLCLTLMVFVIRDCLSRGVRRDESCL